MDQSLFDSNYTGTGHCLIQNQNGAEIAWFKLQEEGHIFGCFKLEEGPFIASFLLLILLSLKSSRS